MSYSDICKEISFSCSFKSFSTFSIFSLKSKKLFSIEFLIKDLYDWKFINSSKVSFNYEKLS